MPLKKQRKADTRRYARYHILEYALVFRDNHQEPMHSVVVDVGLGGMQVLARQQFPVGDVCSVEIGLDCGKRLAFPSQVRFSKPMAGSGLFATGFRFVPETHEQRSAMVEYVHRIFQRQADQLAG